MGKVKFEDIKTPTTVEGFRKNLVKYYLCDGGTKDLCVMGQESVPVKQLNNLKDLYKGNSEPYIGPLLDFTWDDVHRHMKETGQFFSCHGFFDNEENYTIYENQLDFSKGSKNRTWYGIFNQVLRDFYVKTLGDFSGYVRSQEV